MLKSIKNSSLKGTQLNLKKNLNAFILTIQLKTNWKQFTSWKSITPRRIKYSSGLQTNNTYTIRRQSESTNNLVNLLKYKWLLILQKVWSLSSTKKVKNILHHLTEKITNNIFPLLNWLIKKMLLNGNNLLKRNFDLFSIFLPFYFPFLTNYPINWKQ